MARSYPDVLAYPTPALADEVVRLRPWELDDAPLLELAIRDPYIPQTTTVPEVYGEPEARAWVARQRRRLTDGDGLSLAIADGTGAALGAATLMRRGAGVATIGYWLVEPARGRGLATRAVRLLSRWALAEGGMTRLEAMVEPWNEASQRVLERAGLARDGACAGTSCWGGGRPTWSSSCCRPTARKIDSNGGRARGAGDGRRHGDGAARGARATRRDGSPGGRRVAALEDVARTIEAEGGRALRVAGDLATPDGPAAVVERTLAEAGGLDVLVNNAGSMTLAPFGEFAAAAFDAELATNVRAPFLLCQAALPALGARRPR